jgi:hypothetical protein
MPAGEEGQLGLLYSSIFLSLMAITERMMETIPIAKKVAPDCQFASPNPPAAHPMKLVRMFTQPTMNNTQTLIYARALKIGGISPSFWLYFAHFRYY